MCLTAFVHLGSWTYPGLWYTPPNYMSDDFINFFCPVTDRWLDLGRWTCQGLWYNHQILCLWYNHQILCLWYYHQISCQWYNHQISCQLISFLRVLQRSHNLKYISYVCKIIVIVILCILMFNSTFITLIVSILILIWFLELPSILMSLLCFYSAFRLEP